MPKPLTELEYLLLLSVLRVGEGAYAGALQEELEETAERSASLGTIYVTMTRLEAAGLVESRMGEPTAVRGGKAKRLYRVTPAGEAAVARTRAAYDRMWEGTELGESATGSA